MTFAVACSVVVAIQTALVLYMWRGRRAQACALRNARESVRHFIDSFSTSPVPLAIQTLETERIVDVNTAFADMIGWSRDELIGRTTSSLGLRDARPDASLGRRLRRSGVIRGISTTARCRDGQLRDVVLALNLIDIDGKSHAMIAIIDHTDRKRTEAALQSSDERFRDLADTIRDVFWMISPERTKVLYVSKAYETIWQRSCESLIANPEGWFDTVHPLDRARMRAAFAGTDEAPEEFRIVRPDGSVRWIRNTRFISRDADGRALRIAGIATDITDARQLEDQLRQSQKMESLGLLAGGVAHDFNNMLAVISACSELLAESVEPSHPDRELVTDIEDTVMRATALTRQLLAFSRKQVTDPVVLDPNAIVDDTRKMLRRMVGEDITLETSLDPDLQRTRIDAGNLVQILMNLAVNARDAMHERGVLTITTRNAGDHVMLSVSDTGCGMSAELQARIFEPFFTTKGVGRGTGMGLAVVHGIVEQARGKIEIESTIGVGTTFRVMLPAAAPHVDAVTDDAPPNMRGSELVLMVDDDDYVRRAASRALRSRGYNVLEAGDGATALKILEHSPVRILVTDIVMPGMDGRQLADAARTAAPELKVLYTSGYADDTLVKRRVRASRVPFIVKPFGATSLASKVRQVLDASP